MTKRRWNRKGCFSWIIWFYLLLFASFESHTEFIIHTVTLLSFQREFYLLIYSGVGSSVLLLLVALLAHTHTHTVTRTGSRSAGLLIVVTAKSQDRTWHANCPRAPHGVETHLKSHERCAQLFLGSFAARRGSTIGQRSAVSAQCTQDNQFTTTHMLLFSMLYSYHHPGTVISRWGRCAAKGNRSNWSVRNVTYCNIMLCDVLMLVKSARHDIAKVLTLAFRRVHVTNVCNWI